MVDMSGIMTYNRTKPVVAPRPSVPATTHNPHFGSFLKPENIYIKLGADAGGGAAGAITAALEQSSEGTTKTKAHSADIVVSLILVVIIVFISFMASFFWRKYRKISVMRSASAYEYSQLSQCEGESADLTEVADDHGVFVNTSTDEEDLEPACPATINVTSSYISPLSSSSTSSSNNNNNNNHKDGVNNNNNNNSQVADNAVSLIQSPVPLLPQMPPPLQPESVDENKPSVRLTLFADSDEELLQ